MIKIAIIDDNKGARNALKEIIEFNFKDVFNIKEANGVLTGHRLIIDFDPEIVLLDVEMADGTGLDLLKLFPEITFNLVFITAHKEYAIKAIKHRPHDYLLKPLNPFDLIKILNLLISSKANLKSNEKIIIKNHSTSTLLEQKDIIRCEADGAYTKIITLNEVLLASKNLKHYEGLLNKDSFFRVHNAHLVNVNFIREFNRHIQSGLIMKNGDKIPVSSRKTKEISAFINSLG